MQEVGEISRTWLVENSLTIEESRAETEPSSRRRDSDTLTSTLAIKKPQLVPEPILEIKKWTGVILAATEGVLTVELRPSDHEDQALEADFDAGLLGPDSAVIRPGDVIYVTTSYIRGKWSYPKAMTELRMRRLGQWSEAEISEIEELARHRALQFQEDAE
jgi:hypothetical protein